jgi:hypothetical protein
MSYSKTHKTVFPGLGGWTYQGDVALGDPPVGGFYVDQTSMSSGAPTVELNVTDDNGIDHSDWLQDLVNTNHLILRDRACPEDSLVFELSTNTPGAGFRTLVGDIRSGSGTFRVGATYDLWSITTSEDFVTGPASSTLDAVPTFSDGTGKVIQDNPTLKYNTGELLLESATAALEIQERNLAPTFAVAKGHVWVRDDVPNTLVFTDDDGTDHPIFDFIVGPAPSTLNSVPTFSGTTGKLLQDNPTLLYTSGELQLTSATAALEIQERAAAPTDAVGKGHVWVRDDAPNTLVFTDDDGADHPLGPPNNVSLGEWAFGGTLSITSIGEFDTNNATLASITAIRFNASPNSGQAITTWVGFLPQKGILYFQDVTDPGGTSVTFPYTSLTFPIGGAWPQFNGVALATNGTDHGTNWSANDYSVQIVALPATLDETINSVQADNSVLVPSTAPIILRDNAVNFTPLTIISTNTAADTPALQVDRNSTTLSCLGILAPLTALYIEAYAIRPVGNILSNITFSIKPETTTSGAHHGVDVLISGGDHSDDNTGGWLALRAGDSTSGTGGIVAIGDIAEEIVIGSATAPGFTIKEGTDHPVAPVATKAQLWVKDDYLDPRAAGDASAHVRDGQGLMMTDDTGLDINLSWLASNYKTLLGGVLAMSNIEEQGIYAGNVQKLAADNCISYIYDHLSNMWYNAWSQDSTDDAYITSSSDGGYTWEAAKVVDAFSAPGNYAQPCTNGTNLGVSADGYFFLSTSLDSSDVPGSSTGKATNITGSTGLVWSEQASLWVMCGDNVVDGFVYTSPDGITWTNRSPTAFASSVRPVSMDIAHVGYGGYLGTERIIMVCGTTSNDTFYSTNGGVGWTQDTSGNPTNGLECIMWAPSVGQAVNMNQPGVWVGIDASGNLYMSTASQGLDWFDTLISSNTIFRTMEWAGWGNTSVNQTLYQFTGGVDFTAGGLGYGGEMGVAYAGARRRFPSNTVSIRARYQWGNGVTMWDRHGDGELVIGRYGPIKK